MFDRKLNSGKSVLKSQRAWMSCCPIFRYTHTMHFNRVQCFQFEFNTLEVLLRFWLGTVSGPKYHQVNHSVFLVSPLLKINFTILWIWWRNLMTDLKPNLDRLIKWSYHRDIFMFTWNGTDNFISTKMNNRHFDYISSEEVSQIVSALQPQHIFIL